MAMGLLQTSLVSFEAQDPHHNSVCSEIASGGREGGYEEDSASSPAARLAHSIRDSLGMCHLLLATAPVQRDGSAVEGGKEAPGIQPQSSKVNPLLESAWKLPYIYSTI